MDLRAICDAVAARYAPGTLATPTGAVAVREAFGQAPQALRLTPSVVVIPKTGTVELGAGKVDGTIDLDVLFYVSKAPGDLARVEAQRQRWLPELLDALDAKVQLGLPTYVQRAYPVDWEFAELAYNGEAYDGIRVTIRVWYTEPRTFSP